jgi:hypothetical protein
MFDYNRTPLAPPGTRVLAHVPADKRESWAPHALEGWYIGPALQSYRCFEVWLDDTCKTRIVERVTWFPKKVRVPIPTATDEIEAALKDLTRALRASDLANPALPLEQSLTERLKELSNLLANQDGQARADPFPALPPTQSPRVPGPPDPDDPTFTLVTKPKSRKERAAARAARTEASNASCAQALSATASEPAGAWMQPGLALCYKAFHPDTGKLSEYKDLRTSSEGARWEYALKKELARLTKGLPPEFPSGHDVFEFIHKHEVPRHKTCTYLRIVSNYRPQKADPYRVRFTLGGDRLDYNGNTYTPTSDLTTFKLMINAVLSKPGHRACCIDLSDFYISHKLPEPEYMRIHSSQIPQEFMDYYDLDKMVASDGFLYIRLKGAMFGLKQAGIISNLELIKRLAVDAYVPCKHTPGLFKHKERNLYFCLIVDDFFVDYHYKSDADHLITSLQKHYKCTVDWEAAIYAGIHLKWDYAKRTCDISMPGYIDKALQRFEHPVPTRRQDSPHPWDAPVYGQRTQMVKDPDITPPLPPSGIKRI